MNQNIILSLNNKLQQRLLTQLSEKKTYKVFQLSLIKLKYIIVQYIIY